MDIFTEMNYLAHTLLSGSNEDILLGNFMGDAIKGNKFDHYNNDIQFGVRLHRFIDNYTDKHPKVLESNQLIRSVFHKFSGVVSDIYFDYFLANNFNKYSSVSLEEFSQNVYRILKENYDLLPERNKEMVPYMIKQNWLLSYKSLEGMERVFQGMARRTKFKSNMEEAVQELYVHQDKLEACFIPFFEDIKSNCELKISKHLES